MSRANDAVSIIDALDSALATQAEQHQARDLIFLFLEVLDRALAERALQCGFYPQADDPCVCCCGKPRGYHWKQDARAAIAKARGE